jgi:hypothetical protein
VGWGFQPFRINDLEMVGLTGVEPAYLGLCSSALVGGRSWWAHLEFTRINVAPTILKNQIEEILKSAVISRFIDV